MKIINKTNLDSSATSYHIEIDDADLDERETAEERYNRYLDQLQGPERAAEPVHLVRGGPDAEPQKDRMA